MCNRSIGPEIYTSEEDDGYPYSISAYPDLVDLRERMDLFAGVAGYEAFFSRLETETSTEPIWGEVVSWNIFFLLGIEPELGRFFVHEEGQTIGTHPVVVLGYDYWQKRLGGDPDIVGESLRLGGRQYTVVGVAPEARQREAYPEAWRGRSFNLLPSSEVAIHPIVDGTLYGVAALLLTVVALVLSLGLAQAIRGFLYGVGAMDPVTFLGVPALLAAVALVAAFVPARRASRVNPIQALKSE